MQHITLDTGHVRWSPREEVDAGLYRLLLDHIAAALHGPAPIPELPGWTAHAAAEDGILILTVSRHLRDAIVPLVSIGVTAESRRLVALDRLMRRDDLSIPPIAAEARVRGPWCLVRLYPTVALIPPQDLAWMGDYERCVAWAWLDSPTQGVQ